MIKINAPAPYIPTLEKLINAEYRLNELVQFGSGNDADIQLLDEMMYVLPDWKNQQPPVLFSPSSFTPANFLGIIYAKLSNYEKAYPLLQNAPVLLQQADAINRLQNGIEIHVDASDSSYIALHNKAIIEHYSLLETPEDITTLRNHYTNAIQAATSREESAFTTKHYGLLLIDAGCLREAEELMQRQLSFPLSAQAAIELKHTLCIIWMKQLAVPYDSVKLEKHTHYLRECLEFYEATQRSAEAAMVLSDAAYIAAIGDSHSEALGYINRAIACFEKEELKELLGEAFMRKGYILRRWAQQNNPAFFRQAVKAYQQALKIFTRETAPWLFADIHHQLGIVYSEIPDEVKKKSVWASVSVSSFQEALNFYNKVDYPYEFAIICNSQANAFTRYPDALHSDNFEKALNWYQEALSVQSAGQYPLERALTLLNYLEASWYAGNRSDFDEARYTEMIDTAQEIIAIATDDSIIQSAQNHIEKLNRLRKDLAPATRV